MARSNDAATRAARRHLYLSRAQNGTRLARTLAFYPGSPTIPNSYTGNLILGASSDGPAAHLIDGVGPPVADVVPCDRPLISDVEVDTEGANVTVVVMYANPDPDSDVYLLFSTTSSLSFTPLSVVEGPGLSQVTLTFPDFALFGAGFYSLRIARASDPRTCLDVRGGLINVEGPTCTLELLLLEGDGVQGFALPIADGTTDNTVQITGAGFLDGPLTVQIVGGDVPQTLNITNENIINDSTLELTFDAVGSEAPDPATGEYVVSVARDDLAECDAQIGTIVLDEALPACTLTITRLRGDGVQGHRPPEMAGTTGHVLQVTGSGFLDGTLDVEIVGGLVPQQLDVTNINILTDTTMTVTYDALPLPAEGNYDVVITRTDIADCSATRGTVVIDPVPPPE